MLQRFGVSNVIYGVGYSINSDFMLCKSLLQLSHPRGLRFHRHHKNWPEALLAFRGSWHIYIYIYIVNEGAKVIYKPLTCRANSFQSNLTTLIQGL